MDQRLVYARVEFRVFSLGLGVTLTACIRPPANAVVSPGTGIMFLLQRVIASCTLRFLPRFYPIFRTFCFDFSEPELFILIEEKSNIDHVRTRDYPLTQAIRCLSYLHGSILPYKYTIVCTTYDD